MPCRVDTQWETAEAKRVHAENRRLQHLLMQLCLLAETIHDLTLPTRVAAWQSKAILLDPKALDIGLEKTTQLLCSTCRAWDKATNGAHTGIKNLDKWWIDHRVSDLLRRRQNRK
jgi:hypothetical protein